METITEKMAVIFKTLEDEMNLAEREFTELSAQYIELSEKRAAAYDRWKLLEQMFVHADALKGMIEEKEETSE